jgi:hypothetical protein
VPPFRSEQEGISRGTPPDLPVKGQQYLGFKPSRSLEHLLVGVVETAKCEKCQVYGEIPKVFQRLPVTGVAQDEERYALSAEQISHRSRSVGIMRVGDSNKNVLKLKLVARFQWPNPSRVLVEKSVDRRHRVD